MHCFVARRYPTGIGVVAKILFGAGAGTIVIAFDGAGFAAGGAILSWCERRQVNGALPVSFTILARKFEAA
jgi:hypothetical protein